MRNPKSLITGATAESRNCFHIPVIRYIFPLDPAIKSQDDRYHASQGPLCKRVKRHVSKK